MSYNQAEIIGAWRKGRRLAIDEATHALATWRILGVRVVFTNGCFAGLHAGHIELFQEAAKLGGVLAVSFNSAESVRRLKGADKPCIPDAERGVMISSLECVGMAFCLSDDTPENMLWRARPSILVKGGRTGDIVGAEIVKGYGGQVVRLGIYGGGCSSTEQGVL